MKLQRAVQFASVTLVILMLVPGPGLCQNVPGTPLAATSATTLLQQADAVQSVRAFPYLRLGSGLQITYLGTYTADAIFRTPSKMAAVTGYFPEEAIRPATHPARSAPRREIPESMLVSAERVVENFEPPAHAVAAVQAHSTVGEMRNRFLTYAYGRTSVLYAPRHVATDSQQRLIISDPAGNAVHVIDGKGRDSFRIVSGPGRRLRRPDGVAVDAQDNIYVADPERGMVVVFDRGGNFVRDIGSYRGEPEYARPTGIAIDRGAKRLYVIDTPRNLVFVLDLSGNVLQRLGKLRDGSGKGEFAEPTAIAINHDHIFVLDERGTRVQVMDREYNPVGNFSLPHGPDPTVNRENALGTDKRGNVYVSSFHSSMIRVYSHDGRLLSAFGRPGHAVGEFAAPGGLWIDSADRLYVADSGNGRVQLFQLKATQ